MLGIGSNFPRGKMYTFVCKDGNDKCHIAAGHGGNESSEEWKFFLLPWLSYLMNDQSNIITDQMGGIINAICSVQTTMNKRIKEGNLDDSFWWHQSGKDYFYDRQTNLLKNWTVCSHHKYGNIKKTFGVGYAEIYKKYCKCLTFRQYETCVEEMKNLAESNKMGKIKKKKLYEYIFDDDERKFLFTYWCGVSRNGGSTSQAGEIMNAVCKGRSPTGSGFARYKHPILMVATVYNWYVATLKQSFKECENWDHKLTKAAKTKCDKTIAKSKHVSIKPGNACNFRQAYTITSPGKDGLEPQVHKVSVNKFECDCGQPQENKRFCKHMAAVIFYRNRMNGDNVQRNHDIYDFVKPIHTMDNFNKMKNKILKFPLIEIDIDALIDAINEKQKDITRILPPPYKKYMDSYAAVKKFLDKKQKVRKPGPKPSTRVKIGAGEGNNDSGRLKSVLQNI